jgi:hypothetical protein
MRALDPLHIVPGHGSVPHDTEYLDRVIAVLDPFIERAFAEATAKKPEGTLTRGELS